MINLPKNIPVFPLPNFIIFPHITVPLNIFEPRYIEMIKDSMKLNKMIGLIQPKTNSINSVPELYNVGCLGEITNLKHTSNGNYLIDLHGLSRFRVIKEVKNNKLYRECEINFDQFKGDLNLKKQELKFSDLDLVFKNLKIL